MQMTALRAKKIQSFLSGTIIAALWANLVMGSQWWLLAEFHLFFSALALLRFLNFSP